MFSNGCWRKLGFNQSLKADSGVTSGTFFSAQKNCSCLDREQSIVLCV